MPRRKQPCIVLTQRVLEVEPLTEFPGYNVFDVQTNFTKGKAYKVYGVAWYRYSDGSGVWCWLVEDDRGVVVPKAMERFKVVKAVEFGDQSERDS